MRPQDTADLLSIFTAGLDAVRGDMATAQFLSKFSDWNQVKGKVYVAGAGKASACMAKTIEEKGLAHFPEKFAGGMVIVKDGHGADLRKVRCLEAGHPIPDARGLAAATEMITWLGTLDPEDLLFFCLSGGASALLPMPVAALSLQDKIEITQHLMHAGADICDLNTVRKHFSQIKGGQLMQRTKARVITLAISDVPSDDPQWIGSGLTVPDATTVADARAILKKFPELSQWENGLHETPKADAEEFLRSEYHLIATPKMAVQAAVARAKTLGFSVVQPVEFLGGDIAVVEKRWQDFRRQINNPVTGKRSCVILSAEPTVNVKGKGRGGRNTELALRMAIRWGLSGPFAFLAAGTDGTDGPTNAAGAVCDETTLAQAMARGLSPKDALESNDSYTFFHALDQLVVTGPTATNVMDLEILLV